MVETNWVDGAIHKVIRVTLNLSWHSLIYTSPPTKWYTFSAQEVLALLWLCPSILKHALAYMVWNWRTQRNDDLLNTSKHTQARTHILNSMRNVYKLSNTVMLLKLGVLYEKKLHVTSKTTEFFLFSSSLSHRGFSLCSLLGYRSAYTKQHQFKPLRGYIFTKCLPNHYAFAT